MYEIFNGMRIVFLGDSITDVKFNKRNRFKIKGAKNYPLQVAETIRASGAKAKIFYRGVASNRSYHVYDRLTRDCIDLKPNLVILLIGVNDAWEDFVPEQYPKKTRPFEPHFREILRRLRAELSDTEVLILTPFLTSTIPEKQGFHQILNEHIGKEIEIAAEFGFDPPIELQPAFDKAEKRVPPASLSTDSVHPTDAGHKVIADEILKRLKTPAKKPANGSVSANRPEGAT